MACAVKDFYSVVPFTNSWLADAEAPQIATDLFESLSPAAFEAEASAALENESTDHVEALLAYAFATPVQCYDMVSATVAGFISQDLRHKDYEATFKAAARVALERHAPVLFQEWLAGNDSPEIKQLVGTELKRLRPAQLVFEAAPPKPRKRKVKSTARFLGW
jgi:hypothetical protein